MELLDDIEKDAICLDYSLHDISQSHSNSSPSLSSAQNHGSPHPLVGSSRVPESEPYGNTALVIVSLLEETCIDDESDRREKEQSGCH